MSLSNILNKSIVSPNSVPWANVDVNSLEANSLVFHDVEIDSLTFSTAPTATTQPYPFLVVSPSGLVQSKLASLVPRTGFTTVNLTAAQSIPNATDTIVRFQTVPGTDPAVSYSNVSGIFTFTVAGYYTIAYQGVFDPNPAGTRWFWISPGTAQRLASTNTIQTGAVFNGSISSSVTFLATAGTQVALHCFQSSGGLLSLTSTTSGPSDFCSIAISRLSTDTAI